MCHPHHRCSGVAHWLQGALCVTAVLVTVAQVCATQHKLRARESKANIETEAVREKAAKQAASQAWIENFNPSLEARENADFLLTPALLVQEALREDIIITYPTE